MKTLVNAVQEQGLHACSFNSLEYPSGIYVYRLKSRSITLTNKMVLNK